MDPNLSSNAVMILAAISAFSRAGLNIVDRHQIGNKKLSIIDVNFWNSVIPAFILVILVSGLGLHLELLKTISSWRTAVFSGMVQLVAYAFSHAFRSLSVNQVTVAGKFSDLFIPIGVWGTTGYWNWETYNFSIATTLVCLPILWSGPHKRNTIDIKIAAIFIGIALVLQASFAPVLAETSNANLSWHQALLFTTGVIIWRSAWCLVPTLRRTKFVQIPFDTLLTTRPFILRSLLTVITQTTFILAIISSASALAWPILNSTGFFAMLLSSLILKEKHNWIEHLVILSICVLAIVKFFLI
jgi:hypothetical protein